MDGTPQGGIYFNKDVCDCFTHTGGACQSLSSEYDLVCRNLLAVECGFLCMIFWNVAK